MVELQKVEAQLARVGMKNKFFGKPEIRELCHILAPGEVIQHAVLGQYEGGFALMVATNHRALLVDKKPWFLTMEDIRYDMVSEVDFYGRLLDATVSIITISKTLTFSSWRQDRLRALVKYIQHRVMQLRHVDNGWQTEDAASVTQPGMVAPAQLQHDFATNYRTHVKQHSMAHMAGQVAMELERRRPIIRPLRVRPSLVSRYRHGVMTPNPTPMK